MSSSSFFGCSSLLSCHVSIPVARRRNPNIGFGGGRPGPSLVARSKSPRRRRQPPVVHEKSTKMGKLKNKENDGAEAPLLKQTGESPLKVPTSQDKGPAICLWDLENSLLAKPHRAKALFYIKKNLELEGYDVDKTVVIAIYASTFSTPDMVDDLRKAEVDIRCAATPKADEEIVKEAAEFRRLHGGGANLVLLTSNKKLIKSCLKIYGSKSVVVPSANLFKDYRKDRKRMVFMAPNPKSQKNTVIGRHQIKGLLQERER